MPKFDAVTFLNGLFQPSEPPTWDPAGDRRKHIDAPSDLPAGWYEYFEERAAIREYDGGQAREHAEAEALRETIDAMRAGEA